MTSMLLSDWPDGGIHAREWISPAAVTWLLKELVENHENHPDLLDSLDWWEMFANFLLHFPRKLPIQHSILNIYEPNMWSTCAPAA